MTTVFTPEARTTVKAVRHINYTCGPGRYAELEEIAGEAGISLKELLRQMVDFAVAHHVSAKSLARASSEDRSLHGEGGR